MLRVVLAAALALALVGCRRPPPPGEPGITGDRILLGSYGPLSGPAASWGVFLKSWQAYFAYINSRGGIGGRTIELRLRDDQYRPAHTESAVRSLVERDQVFAMVGGIGSANTQAVLPYLDKHDVPIYSPASGDASLTQPARPRLFTSYPRYDREGAFIARYAVSRGWRRLAVLQQDDSFGDGGFDGVQQELHRMGGELSARARCLPSDSTVAGQVHRLVESKPDAVVLYVAPSQAVLAVRALRARHPKLPIITSFVLADPVMFRLGGDDWQGIIATTPFALHDEDLPAVVMYRAALKSFDEDLPLGSFTLSAMAYAMPFAEALRRAGPQLTRDKLLEELEGLGSYGGAGPYVEGPGLMPQLSFGPGRHDGAEVMRFLVADNGRWSPLTDFASLTASTAPASISSSVQ